MSLPVNDRDGLFVSLSHEANELYLPRHVPRLASPTTPLNFLRNYVMPNLPVVIENAISHWPALTKWTKEYLRDVIGEKKVTVATTPNGYADATVGDRFVLPHETQMTFEEFLCKLQHSKTGDEIVYVQNQNSSFLEEFAELLPDASEDIGWASEALGKRPDAVNFWMGSSRSVTSMHKDHYENLYGVVAGSKTFILHPPTDLPCIPYEDYVVARYVKNAETGKFDIVDENTSEEEETGIVEAEASADRPDLDLGAGLDLHTDEGSEIVTNEHESSDISSCKCPQSNAIPWIAIDPLNPDYTKYPAYRHANRLTVTLNPGDLLYLPSLWFHHVQQSDDTIAVNFWYDMDYDIKYNYFKFVEQLVRSNHPTQKPS